MQRYSMIYGYTLLGLGLFLFFSGLGDGLLPDTWAAKVVSEPCPKTKVTIPGKKCHEKHITCVVWKAGYHDCVTGLTEWCKCEECKGKTIMATEVLLYGSYSSCRALTFSDYIVPGAKALNKCDTCPAGWRCGAVYCYLAPPTKNGKCPTSIGSCYCGWLAPPGSCY